jgi:hypothetical protein
LHSTTAHTPITIGWSFTASSASLPILDLVAHVRRESKRLAYLRYPAPRQPRRPSQP